MKRTVVDILKESVRPTFIPRFLSSPIFYQIRNYHRTQHWGRIRKALRIAAWREYDLVAKERIVELPFALRALVLPDGVRIMEFGCYGSTLSIELASLGYHVTGVDLRAYPLRHPNFEFRQGDLMKTDFGAPFDAIVAISALEHAGLGAYDEDEFARGDHAIVTRFHDLLVEGGRLIVTVPFGKRAEAPTYRVYDREGIESLFSQFHVDEIRCFRASEGRRWWTPAVPESLAEVDSVSDGWINAVACIVGTKRGRA